jgi:2-methylcitrate synthase
MHLPPRPKKSVALRRHRRQHGTLHRRTLRQTTSHYRGYDISTWPTTCEFEEIAYLLDPMEGCPSAPELAGYKARLRRCAAFPSR